VAAFFGSTYAIYRAAFPFLCEKVKRAHQHVQEKAMAAILEELRSQELKQREETRAASVVCECSMVVCALLPTLHDHVEQLCNVEAAVQHVREQTRKHGRKSDQAAAAWQTLAARCITRLALALHGLALTVTVASVQRILWARTSMADGRKVSQSIKEACLARATEQVWSPNFGGLHKLVPLLETAASHEMAKNEWNVGASVTADALRRLLGRVREQAARAGLAEGMEGTQCDLAVPQLGQMPIRRLCSATHISEEEKHANYEEVDQDCRTAGASASENAELRAVERIMAQSFDLLESPNSSAVFEALYACALDLATECFAVEIDSIVKRTRCVSYHPDVAKASLNGEVNFASASSPRVSAATGATVAEMKEKSVADPDVGNLDEPGQPCSIPLARLLPRMKRIASMVLEPESMDGSASTTNKYVEKMMSLPEVRGFAETLLRHSALRPIY
jgi:hypothetical protein